MKFFNGKKGLVKIAYLIIIFVLLFTFVSISLYAQNETNQTNSTIENVENETLENVSEEISNNGTSINETQNETLENVSEESAETVEIQPNIEMEILFPEKIVRGEDFEIKIEVTNIGESVSNTFTLQTILPDGFESPKENIVDKILPGEKVVVSKKVSSDLSVNTGLNEIKFILVENE